jgi:hypothetical protein
VKRIDMSIARQQRCKHTSVAINTHTTIEDAVLSVAIARQWHSKHMSMATDPCRGYITRSNWTSQGVDSQSEVSNLELLCYQLLPSND